MSYSNPFDPKDVPGECNARCFVYDNFGDNHATFRCSRPLGHPLPHREDFREGTATLTWLKDERRDGPEVKTEVKI